MAKQVAPSRGWCFTINNPSANDDPNDWAEDAQWIIWQLEEGASRTPHLQGYVHLKKKKRISYLKGLNTRAHWEKARGTPEQNRAYCTKEEGRVEGPWEIGSLPKTGVQAMEETMREALDAAAEGRFEDIPAGLYTRYMGNYEKHRMAALQTRTILPLPETSGEWFYGESGAGKSRTARELYPDAYIKACNKWWDGYIDQEHVIMDDVDKGHAVLGHHLKIWGDHYAFTAEKKGGAMYIRPKKIVITSQYKPEQIWDDQATVDAIRRRYKVTEFKHLK